MEKENYKMNESFFDWKGFCVPHGCLVVAGYDMKEISEYCRENKLTIIEGWRDASFDYVFLTKKPNSLI